MSESKPGPCPFCKWVVNAQAAEIVPGGGWFVRCAGCHAQGPVSVSQVTAVERWNQISNIVTGVSANE